MKKYYLICMILLALTSCSPVLNREIMNKGLRDVPFDQLRETPDVFSGRIFVLGGLIVETRLVEKGSQIEALEVPVDSYGYFRGIKHSKGRFLALYPKSEGILDPMVYKKGREVTLAGKFVEARKGRIDEMEYVYPVFEIRELYLWEERKDYHWSAYPYPYYYPYNDPFCHRSLFLYDPWGCYGYPHWPLAW
jgi:outer membrane lipoprotein